MVPPIAGWLWFLDRERGGAALDASNGRSGLATQLEPHFARVETLDETAPRWTAETFDCIALHDNLTRILAGLPGLPGLSRLHALLRPGGWLVGGSANPDCSGGHDGHAGVKLTEATRQLRRAGFREIRCVFATPSLDRPTSLIPNVRGAVRAFETSPATQDAARWTRRAVAFAGPRRLLYPAYFTMARR
jgi:hypothetical protein